VTQNLPIRFAWPAIRNKQAIWLNISTQFDGVWGTTQQGSYSLGETQLNCQLFCESLGLSVTRESELSEQRYGWWGVPAG
jgi:hypothetical protein